MKVGNSFVIAKEELKNEKLLFLIFECIIILLFSVSTAIMEAAMFLPEHISEVVHENMLDVFIPSGNYLYPHDISSVLDDGKIAFCIENCEPMFSVQPAKEQCFGGVLFRDYLNDRDSDLVQENHADSVFFERSAVLISDEMAAQNGLQIGSFLEMLYRNGNEQQAIPAEIVGIFPANPARKDYYLSEGAYHAFVDVAQTTYCIYEISPKNLGDIFRMKSCLEQNGYVIYSKETLSTIRMLYITLYSVNFILLIALAGSVYNFMNIYLQRRQKYYAVQSAIGMSEKDILKILFGISECVVIIMLIISAPLSVAILRTIAGYGNGIFANSKSMNGFPTVPILVDFLLVQCCLAVIMLKFRKRLKDHHIIELLHEN